jgi:YD repeat-containing protein
MIKEIYPSGTVYEYDTYGNMIKKTDSNGDVWQWEYDSCGNRLKTTGPSGTVYQYEYDSFGNKIKKIDPSGDGWTITIE